MPRAATQVFSHEFDAAMERVPANVGEFQLRVGDYRVVYNFDTKKNEIYLITLGHRREIYR